MTIRKVLMWHFVAIVTVGAAGASGYQALRQHRAQLAARHGQEARQIATAPSKPRPNVEAQPSTTTPAPSMQAATAPPLPPLPLPPLPQAAARPSVGRVPAPTVVVVRRPARATSARRHAQYAAARVPPAPRVAYYAYPGYYAYASGYAYYGYYPSYQYYSAY